VGIRIGGPWEHELNANEWRALKQADLHHGEMFRMGDTVKQFVLEDRGRSDMYEIVYPDKTVTENIRQDYRLIKLINMHFEYVNRVILSNNLRKIKFLTC
jgi:hypothetical protein